jgi:hypothetical protein
MYSSAPLSRNRLTFAVNVKSRMPWMIQADAKNGHLTI